MKKTNNLILLCLTVFALGCSGSDNNEGVMNPPIEYNEPDSGDENPPSSSLTYSQDIRTIIGNNCTSCHSNPPTRNAPMSLTTYIEVVDAVTNRGLLGRINSTSNPMPPEGRLPSGTRQLIEDWINLGMPQ